MKLPESAQHSPSISTQFITLRENNAASIRRMGYRSKILFLLFLLTGTVVCLAISWRTSDPYFLRRFQPGTQIDFQFLAAILTKSLIVLLPVSIAMNLIILIQAALRMHQNTLNKIIRQNEDLLRLTIDSDGRLFEIRFRLMQFLSLPARSFVTLLRSLTLILLLLYCTAEFASKGYALTYGVQQFVHNLFNDPPRLIVILLFGSLAYAYIREPFLYQKFISSLFTGFESQRVQGIPPGVVGLVAASTVIIEGIHIVIFRMLFLPFGIAFPLHRFYVQEPFRFTTYMNITVLWLAVWFTFGLYIAAIPLIKKARISAWAQP